MYSCFVISTFNLHSHITTFSNSKLRNYEWTTYMYDNFKKKYMYSCFVFSILDLHSHMTTFSNSKLRNDEYTCEN